MSERTEVCGTCRFFQKTGEAQEDKRGDCRANPPTAAMIEVRGLVPGPGGGKAIEQVRHVPIGMFPVVQSFYWCGKWECIPGRPLTADEFQEYERQKLRLQFGKGVGVDPQPDSDGTRIA